MSDLYESALRRVLWISAALAILGIVVCTVRWGPDTAAGFFAGALLSLVNLRWWRTVAGAVGGSGSTSPRGAMILLALRYLLFAGAIYGIVKILKISPAAPLVGLLVSAVAGMIEALYELIYART